MAISIMPEFYLEKYDAFLGEGKCLCNSNLSTLLLPNFLYTFILNNPVVLPKVKLYVRKKFVPIIPELLFVLEFSHHVFCFFVLGNNEFIYDENHIASLIPQPNNIYDNQPRKLDISSNDIVEEKKIMAALYEDIKIE
jgi:hypothetical protein